MHNIMNRNMSSKTPNITILNFIITLSLNKIYMKDGWIDDFRFYVIFDSISVISERWVDDNESLCAGWNLIHD